MTRSQRGWIHPGRSSRSGDNASSENAWADWQNGRAGGVQPDFPPSVVVAVKALACELPHALGLPLSRFSLPELRREILHRGWVATIGVATLWRWLSQDAIQPWRHRSWIFPRDPEFEVKAGQVLDLYAGRWQDQALGPDEYVISSDEKTSIQVRRRRYPTQAPAPGVAIRVEHEYARCGAWVYFAAWDIRRAKIFGRCEKTSGVAPFLRLVEQVMEQDPYRLARRVFWVVDNGSSHRGLATAQRLQARWPQTVVVHTPKHASWLNQVEIYFSVLQRKVLTPIDCSDLTQLEQRIAAFEVHYQQVARPFQWRFTRADLRALMARASSMPQQMAA
jgi:DDE superfamily endonuclease